MESYTVIHFTVSFVIKMPNIKSVSRCWTWKMINQFYSFNTSHLHDLVGCMVFHFFFIYLLEESSYSLLLCPISFPEEHVLGDLALFRLPWNLAMH
jgi:hypothetical protein